MRPHTNKDKLAYTKFGAIKLICSLNMFKYSRLRVPNKNYCLLYTIHLDYLKEESLNLIKIYTFNAFDHVEKPMGYS